MYGRSFICIRNISFRNQIYSNSFRRVLGTAMASALGVTYFVYDFCVINQRPYDTVPVVLSFLLPISCINNGVLSIRLCVYFVEINLIYEKNDFYTDLFRSASEFERKSYDKGRLPLSKINLAMNTGLSD